MLPFSKRTYSFRAGDVKEANKDSATPVRKIKSRGRTFIGSKTPNENTQEEAGFPLTPFTRGSVRLKSIRKRKMASRDDVKSDEASFKRGKMVGKGSDEIEVKIEENIRMRDGVTKLLSGCHDTRQAMEIGKNLLTINSRVLSLMSSLQKKRSSNILKDYNKSNSGSELSKNIQPCLGDATVSDIRIPLMWKQDAHFKTKAGEQPALLYHMFCLLKINDQVFDTPLFQFSQVDTDVTFDNVFIFRSVPADFKLEIEVYYSVVQNPDNPAWTPMRTPKKSVYSSAPQYCLAAHSQLTVNDIKEGFVVADFTMGGVGASATAVLGHDDDFPDNPLSLWGQFSCQIHARPKCLLEQKLEGHLLFQCANGGQPVWEKYYCRLRNCTIQCWKHFPLKEEGFSMTPGLSIKLKKGMKLRFEKCADSPGRTAVILTSKRSEEKEPVFAFESDDVLKAWEDGLQQAIVDVRAWKTTCYTLVDIEELEVKKKAFSKALNLLELNAANSDVKQMSPVLSRKSTKTSSKATSLLSEITPKVRSFYDQISIATVEDSVDSGVLTKNENQENGKTDNAPEASDASSTNGLDRLVTGVTDASIAIERNSVKEVEDLECKIVEDTGADVKKEDVQNGEDLEHTMVEDAVEDSVKLDEGDREHQECKEDEFHVEDLRMQDEKVVDDLEDKKVEDEGDAEMDARSFHGEVEMQPVTETCRENNESSSEDAIEEGVSENPGSGEQSAVVSKVSEDECNEEEQVAIDISSQNVDQVDVPADSTLTTEEYKAVESETGVASNEQEETEESVLDYLVEAIDSAANLDESTDSCLENGDVIGVGSDEEPARGTVIESGSSSSDAELNENEKSEDVSFLDNTEFACKVGDRDVDVVQQESLVKSGEEISMSLSGIVEKDVCEVGKEEYLAREDDSQEDTPGGDLENVMVERSCEEAETNKKVLENCQEVDNVDSKCSIDDVIKSKDIEDVNSSSVVNKTDEEESVSEDKVDGETGDVKKTEETCVAETLEDSITNGDRCGAESNLASVTSSSDNTIKVETDV